MYSDVVDHFKKVRYKFSHYGMIKFERSAYCKYYIVSEI